jgi:hypothetical protein
MIDVTRKVSFGYDDMAKACVCGRKYVFENKVTIYQVVDK